MPVQIIPLDSSQNQSFFMTLNVDNNPLALRADLHYNQVAGYWVLRLSDPDNNLLLDSIPLLTGDFPAENLLGQFAYLNLGSLLIYNFSQVAKDHPDSTDLGTDFLAVWSDTPQVGQS